MMSFIERGRSWRKMFAEGILVGVEWARMKPFAHVWFVILLAIQVEIAGRLLDIQVWSSERKPGMEILTLYNRCF